MSASPQLVHSEPTASAYKRSGDCAFELNVEPQLARFLNGVRLLADTNSLF